MKLKVYGIPYMGRYRRIVATTSWAKAAEAIGVGVRYARDYGSITGNESEIFVAMSSPGDAFQAKNEWRTYKEWEKVQRARNG